MTSPAARDSSHESLLTVARAAAATAYAPYSRFAVGAAVVSAGGAVFAGCNVENAAYGLTICAERGAISAMVLAGETAVRSVAIIGLNAAPCFPCGACRQVLAEFGCEEVVVEEDGVARAYPFAEILPHGFGAADLQR